MAEEPKIVLPKSVDLKKGQSLLDKQRWAPFESASADGRIIKTEQAFKFLREKFPDFDFACWDDNDVQREAVNGWEVWTAAHWAEVESWNAAAAGRSDPCCRRQSARR